MAVYPDVGATGSLGFGTATAIAAHAEMDGVLYVHISYCPGEDDTPGCGGEEDEESDIEEDGNEGSDKLRDKLVLRPGAKEVTRLHITDHIRGLGGRPGRKRHERTS